MTIAELQKLVRLLEWSTRWYPRPEEAKELLELAKRELNLKTLNPVTGNHDNDNI